MSSLCPHFTPENTQIHFDLDKTIILRPQNAQMGYNIFKLLNQKYDTLTCFALLGSFLQAKLNPNGCVTGHPWSLLYTAMHDARLRPYMKEILTIAQKRNLVPGADLILKRLQEKGYEIVYATNKDRISYDLIAKKLGPDFSSVPYKVITYFPEQSHPFFGECKKYLERHKKNQDDFYTLINDIYSLHETETIIHTPYLKPDKNFTQLQRRVAGNKHIIFFDDIIKNIIEAGKDDNIYGFNTKESAVEIVNALVLLGILQPNTDPLDRTVLESVNQLEYQGITGSIKHAWNKIQRTAFKQIVTPAVKQFTMLCTSVTPQM